MNPEEMKPMAGLEGAEAEAKAEASLPGAAEPQQAAAVGQQGGEESMNGDALNINLNLEDEGIAEGGMRETVLAEAGGNDPHFSLRSLRAEAEIYAISKTLEYTGWNRRRAAQLLSISYRGILYKIRQHNLTPRSVHGAGEVVQTAKAE
jgi:DNA-binding NtrC family response regulator